MFYGGVNVEQDDVVEVIRNMLQVRNDVVDEYDKPGRCCGTALGHGESLEELSRCVARRPWDGVRVDDNFVERRPQAEQGD